MACSKCGKNKAANKCALCQKDSTNFYPWGTTRKICWRCHDAMVARVERNKNDTKRIETLLKGEDA
jgi:hypothetical protein